MMMMMMMIASVSLGNCLQLQIQALHLQIAATRSVQDLQLNAAIETELNGPDTLCPR